MKYDYVTIKTPKTEKGGIAISQGTSVWASGHVVNGIRNITVEIAVDEAIQAKIELCAYVDVVDEIENAEAHWYMFHPRTDERVEIKSVQLVGGGEIVFKPE